MNLTDEQIKYVENSVKNGTSLRDALAQANVLQEEYDFKQNLLHALNHPDVKLAILSLIEQGGPY